jgi:SpoVK/Ycf46/Vps4 family AAA+-type ATPase
MAIERIQQAVNLKSGNRFFVLYGSGIEDTFINQVNQEIDLESALLQFLKENGFKRIAFISPHRTIYFRDEESQRLSRYSNQSLPHTSITDSDRMQVLKGGPLQERLLLSAEYKTENDQGFHGMGDTHALRNLNAIMADSKILSAVIMIQAESTLQYLDDQRTLAGLLGDWSRLPASNSNLCFLMFSSTNYSDLCDDADQISIPTIRNAIHNRINTSTNACGIYQLGGPDRKEMRRLLHLAISQYQTPSESSEISMIATWMSSEGGKARQWLTRVRQIERLDLEHLRQSGWFASIQDTNQSLQDRLKGLVGLKEVKQRILEMEAYLRVLRKSQAAGSTGQNVPLLHLIFTGNPGTGKTTVARLMGEIYHELGLLRRGQLIEARASDLISDHVGGTSIKTNNLIDQALDGILFIDEAYMLTEPERGGFGQEAVDTLLARLENDRGRLVVIAAGYPEKMSAFRRSNPGISRRFPEENVFHFSDFDANELQQVLDQISIQRRIPFNLEAKEKLNRLVSYMAASHESTFGNAGEIRNLVDGLERKRAARIIRNGLSLEEPVDIEDIPNKYLSYLPPETIDLPGLLQELDRLVGLDPVKTSIKQLIQKTQIQLEFSRRNPSLNSPKPVRHLIFCGNPGTGKTTIARLIGKIYRSLGLLRQGQTIEVTRADLVAGFVGQTALKTTAVVKSAINGVLFIDEVYALQRGGENDFGQEAIDTLVKLMEENQGQLVVIAAGYPAEMEFFLESNPGLRSRFSLPIHFPDYSTEDLCKILEIQAEEQHFILPINVLEKAAGFFDYVAKRDGSSFGNARQVSQLLEDMKSHLAERVMALYPDAESLTTAPNELLSTFIDSDISDHPLSISVSSLFQQRTQ